MNLKEQLRVKKAELAALKSGITAGDPVAIKSGTEIAEAIASIEAAIAEAQKANDLLSKIGEDVPAEPARSTDTEGVKGLLAKLKSVDRSSNNWSVSTRVKANTSTVTAPTLTDIDRTVAPVKRLSRLADLFASAQLTGNTVTYFVNGGIEGDAGVTAQGTQKSQISTSFTPVTKTLSKITAYVKETTEMIDDAAFLASTIEDIIGYKIISKENTEVASSIVATSGIQAITYGTTGDAESMAEAILLAKSKISIATDYAADCVLINPQDMYTILTSKDRNDQYLGGGYFSGAYGNGAYSQATTIWGLPVFESSAVAVGSPIVASGRAAVKIYRKNDITVRMYDQNEDDAINNLVTVLGEELLLVAVTDPKGVVKISAAV